MIHEHRGIVTGNAEHQRKLWQLRLSQWVVLLICSCLLISLLVTAQKKMFAPDATDAVTLLIVLSCSSAAIAIIAGIELLKSKQIQQHETPSQPDAVSPEDAHQVHSDRTSMTDALVPSEQVTDISYGATLAPESRPNN